MKEDKYNYFLVRRFLQRKVGGIEKNDITRFGKRSLLIHAKSDFQSQMLLNMKLEEQCMLKEVKPHTTFSYGKGVIFNTDLYDFHSEEILDMSPSCVSNVYKVPRTKSMIIVTFTDEHTPDFIVFEGLRVPVRPLKLRPMQCFNCFDFGHTAKNCKHERLCRICSGPYHEDCTLTPSCINCHIMHISTSKECSEYKKEEEALYKAKAEHISIGHAKMLLSNSKNYKDSLMTSRGGGHVLPVTPHPSRRDYDVNPCQVSMQSEVKSCKSSHQSGVKPKIISPQNQAPERSTSDSKKESQERNTSISPNRKKKRNRTPSSSPPKNHTKEFVLENRYEILSGSESDGLNDMNMETENVVATAEKDKREERKVTESTQIKKNKTGNSNKPLITRPAKPSTSACPGKNQKPEKKKSKT